MASYAKQYLSGGSGDGRPTKIVATASAGTTIHTAHATDKDEVWIWASNTDSAERTLTIQFGGTTSPDDSLVVTIPAGDMALVVPGIPISGAKVIRGFASTANVITVFGYVNRITP